MKDKEKQKLTFEQECSLIANGEDLPQAKQIEEMANDICAVCREQYGDCGCKDKLCLSVKIETECLYNAGYRKLPKNSVVLKIKELEDTCKCCPHRKNAELNKDSVVLSKEEYEKLLELPNKLVDTMDKNITNALAIERREIRKETAEKIITKIKQFLSSVETVRGDDENKLQPQIGYKCSEVDDFLDKLENNSVLK